MTPDRTMTPDLIPAPVGRGYELGQLRAALDAARDGPQLVVLTGAPWIGKTHLLAALCDEAAGRGWTVARGRPASDMTSASFEVFADALDEHLIGVAGDGYAGMFDEPMPAGRQRVFRRCRSLLGVLATRPGTAGLVLALDDTHRADERSTELIDHLARHPPDGPVLIALAGRAGRSPAAAWTGHVRQVEPGPLRDEELNRLIPYRIGWARRRLLCAASGGSPGVLRALLDAAPVVGDGPDSETAEDLHAGVPPVVPAAFHDDLRAVPVPCRLVAQAAAVCGDPFGPAVVGAVAQLTEAEIRDALDRLLAEGLIRPAGTWREFQFRDPVLRAVVYHSAPAGWHTGAHARAAQALSGTAALAALRACQIERSAATGDLAGARALLGAARDNLFQMPERAGRWLRTSALVSGRESPPELAWLLGVTLALAGRLGESRQVLGPAGTGAPARPAEVVEWCARVHRLLGRYDEARAVLGTAPDVVGADPTGRCLERAALAYDAGADAADWPWDELRAAAGHPDPLLRAHALGLLGAGYVTAGRNVEAAEVALAATATIDTASGDEVARRPDALYWAGEAELRLGRHAEAARHFGRALHAGGRLAHGHLCTHLSVGLGEAILHTGELRAAAGCADHAADAAQLSGGGQPRVAALTLRSLVFGAVGDAPAALVAARQAVALSSAYQDRWSVRAAEALALALAAPAVPDRPRTGTTDTASGTGLESLSRREAEVARLVSEGRTNQQIASALRLSPKTVEAYLTRIFKKLDIGSRSQVAHLVGLAER
jgi:DNA-binding CsgD family transcriptional regulator